MLKERLEAIAKPSLTRFHCRMPEIFVELDEETTDVLRDILRSTAPIRSISRALQDEGYQISRDAVDHARRVLAGEQTCECMPLLKEETP